MMGMIGWYEKQPIPDEWHIPRNKCANCENWYTIEQEYNPDFVDDTYCWEESCYES